MKGFHLRFSTDSNIAKEFHVRTSKLSNDKFKAIKYTRDWYHYRWKYFNLNTTVAKNFPVDNCAMCARAKRDMTDIIPKYRESSIVKTSSFRIYRQLNKMIQNKIFTVHRPIRLRP